MYLFIGCKILTHLKILLVFKSLWLIKMRPLSSTVYSFCLTKIKLFWPKVVKSSRNKTLNGLGTTLIPVVFYCPFYPLRKYLQIFYVTFETMLRKIFVIKQLELLVGNSVSNKGKIFHSESFQSTDSPPSWP